jgi:N-acylglucosamine 2-epimerase
MLSVFSELEASALPAPAPAPRDYSADKAACVRDILLHAHAGKRVLLEHVRPDGSFCFDSADGRVHNPGHAIEAGWFLLEHARSTGDAGLKATALAIIRDNFDAGWDPVHGGITYFLDAEGYTPPQLEHAMKLWWPAAEAMIAFAMAFDETLEQRDLDCFERVAAWTYAHLVDRTHGEWFGYADAAGAVTHRFKGGAYKGCFHVPRALLMCHRLLSAALAKVQARAAATAAAVAP